MQRIRENVNLVHQRRQRQWVWQCVSTALLVSGAVGCLLAIARVLAVDAMSISGILAVVLAGPMLGLAYAFLRPRRVNDAAAVIDDTCGLKDRVGSAMNFLTKEDNSLVHQLQIEDAQSRIDSIPLERVAPIAAPRHFGLGIGLACLAGMIAFYAGEFNPAQAAAVPNAVVVTQASRITDSLEELKQFNQEDLDPDVEKLLKELAEQIEELKQAETDPKEALAKLSEMEAALLEQQDKLNEQDTDAVLQDVGKALALEESLAAAGAAMAESKLAEAAEELEKAELPKLDRKTEKAMQEKLDQAQQNAGSGAQRKLKEAIAAMSQGMTSGDRSKFREGANGLASQCRKQGRRKKLSDLLRKQCKCLGECKSECECECKSKSDCKKKGGSKAGAGSSGNQPGDKTGLLKSGQKLQLKGQESASGDVDVETIKSNEQQQEAVRKYREKSESYEQLTESVLSSEPIPLGHRQTIRRYFEMIRPQAGETEEVIERTE